MTVSNVTPLQPRIDRRTGYAKQRIIAANAVRRAAVEVGKLAEFSKAKRS